MPNNLVNTTEKDFESIKHIDENGVEFWYARELMTMLEYSKWGNFVKVIDKAKESCKNSNMDVLDHFADIGKMIMVAKGAERKIDDYKLTRYACYLIAQNGDSRKKTIALAQTYFAVQTRKQEIYRQEYEQLSEDEKRLYTRQNVKDKNKYLFDTAKLAGVKNYGKFNNYGYRGLYNGETAKDIADRKGISEKELEELCQKIYQPQIKVQN
ncbi:MAG: DNA damage-inducible protein D [Clostridia bacterium]